MTVAVFEVSHSMLTARIEVNAASPSLPSEIEADGDTKPPLTFV